MEIVHTLCAMCSGDNCGIDVYIQDGEIADIKGTPSNPLSEGRLCVQARSARELVADPQRLSHPLLRQPNGEWGRISWDQALDTIAARLLDVKAKYGAQAFALWEGTQMWQFMRDGWDRRFLNLFGSPNWVQHDHLCYEPSVIAERLTYGQEQIDGWEGGLTRCLLLWGSDPATSHNPFQWHAVHEAQRQGAKLIVIDPRRSEAAKRADLHLAPRPGSDIALALALLNVVIAEKLYDADFVERWTFGFDALAERVKPYTPEWASRISGVPDDDIRRCAAMYCSAHPAHLDAGNALEHHTNSAQTLRAAMILRALTGNLDVPGGHVLGEALPLANMQLSGHLPTGLRPLGSDRYPLFVECAGFVPGNALLDAMLTGRPYPIKAVIMQGTNPLLTWPNSTLCATPSPGWTCWQCSIST